MVLVVVLLVVLLLLWLYFRESGPPDTGGVDPGIVAEPARQAADQLYAQPWFWTAAVAVGLGVLGFMTWRRIGGWGRGTVLVFTAISATVWVVTSR
jgi:hypothetical protein